MKMTTWGFFRREGGFSFVTYMFDVLSDGLETEGRK